MRLNTGQKQTQQFADWTRPRVSYCVCSKLHIVKFLVRNIQQLYPQNFISLPHSLTTVTRLEALYSHNFTPQQTHQFDVPFGVLTSGGLCTSSFLLSSIQLFFMQRIHIEMFRTFLEQHIWMPQHYL